MIGLAVLVFGLFYLIGYDLPFDENPDFNAPLFYRCAHHPDVAFPDRRSRLGCLFDGEGLPEQQVGSRGEWCARCVVSSASPGLPCWQFWS